MARHEIANSSTRNPMGGLGELIIGFQFMKCLRYLREGMFRNPLSLSILLG